MQPLDKQRVSGRKKIPLARRPETPSSSRNVGPVYIFENERQSFRIRKDRDLELKSAPHTYTAKGRYTVAVKVIDIFGNDTMVLVPVNVG